MNVNTLNENMKSQFHTQGYKGKNIIFAVIDSGVNSVGYLSGNITYSPLYPNKDTNGHGTFVGSELLSWCPEAKIISYNVLPNGSGTLADTLKALKNVLVQVNQNPTKQFIVNMSLSGELPTGSLQITQYESIIKSLVKANVPVFVAAGNDGKQATNQYPSCFESPICISAINTDSSWAEFSTFHNEVDFGEYGVNVAGLSLTGGSTKMSGTSMACPNAAGKAGLICSEYYTKNNSWLSERDLYTRLKELAVDIHIGGYDPYTGNGYISLKVASTNSVVENTTSTLNYTRVLKYGNTGDDVLYIKGLLFNLGYFDKKYTNKTLTLITSKVYGSDTVKAVTAFQNEHSLSATGQINAVTWSAIVKSSSSNNTSIDTSNGNIVIPYQIGNVAAEAIKKDLVNVSEIRKNICLEALTYAIDTSNLLKSPLSFYIRGANLYDKDLTLHVMTKSRLATYFANKDYKDFYSNGRKEMIETACASSGYTLSGADCSGGVVGIWRKFNIQPTSFDTTANNLFKNYCTKVTTPTAGDLVWKSGHIGIYVGGGYIVEWCGGAYGCQLSTFSVRKMYNFVTNKYQSLTKWSYYGKPKTY